MSETEFIKREQFLAALREKGLLVGREQAFGSEAMGMAAQAAQNILGPSPTVLTMQVDNGYMVVFSPSKVGVKSKRHVIEGRVVQPYPGTPGSLNPEEQQILLQREMERRREIAIRGLRVKVRVRVYPALSQAMGEIKKFYEAGGIVPGIDFEKLADEAVEEIGEEDAFAV